MNTMQTSSFEIDNLNEMNNSFKNFVFVNQPWVIIYFRTKKN